MVLVENGNIITDDTEIANIMNNHFSTITKSLNIKNWPEPKCDGTEDSIMIAIMKYANHPSIVKIKSHYKSNKMFKLLVPRLTGRDL